MNFITKPKNNKVKFSFSGDDHLLDPSALKKQLLEYLDVLPENFMIEMHITGLNLWKADCFSIFCSLIRTLKHRSYSIHIFADGESFDIINSLHSKDIDSLDIKEVLK